MAADADRPTLIVDQPPVGTDDSDLRIRCHEINVPADQLGMMLVIIVEKG
jgi:hypothetical protein